MNPYDPPKESESESEQHTIAANRVAMLFFTGFVSLALIFLSVTFRGVSSPVYDRAIELVLCFSLFIWGSTLWNGYIEYASRRD